MRIEKYHEKNDREKIKKGMKMAIIYALGPNRFGLCGPKRDRQLLDFLEIGIINQELVKDLKKFKTACSFYSLISKKYQCSLFAKKVVEVYWLGNDILESFFTTNLIPYHNFYVFNKTLENKSSKNLADLCRIAWGKILKIKPKTAKIVVEYKPIKIRNKKFYFGQPIKKEIDWNKKIAPNLKIGDYISFHWNQVCQILTKAQLANLKKYTILSIEKINQQI